MKTSYAKLFSLIAVGMLLAGGSLANAAGPSRAFSRSNMLASSKPADNKPSLEQNFQANGSPWNNNNLSQHSVQSQWGQASGGSEVKVLETRAGTYVNHGDNGYGAGAAAQAHLFRVTAGGQAQTETIRHNGREILSNRAAGDTEIYAGARAYSEAGISYGGKPEIKAVAGGTVGEHAEAKGTVGSKFLGGGYGLNGSASAGVGAEGNVGAEFGQHGSKIGVSGFAGDRATATGGVEVLGVGVGGTAEGWAGVGGEISSASGFENGKLRIKGQVGAALGIGGRVGVDVTVDVNKVQEEGAAFGNNVAHYGQQGIDAIQSEVPKAANVAGNEIVKAANQTGTAITNVANQAGSEITNTANTVGNGITDTANTVGNTISSWFSW